MENNHLLLKAQTDTIHTNSTSSSAFFFRYRSSAVKSLPTLTEVSGNINCKFSKQPSSFSRRDDLPSRHSNIGRHWRWQLNYTNPSVSHFAVNTRQKHLQIYKLTTPNGRQHNSLFKRTFCLSSLVMLSPTLEIVENWVQIPGWTHTTIYRYL